MRAVPITDKFCTWLARAGKLKIKSISCEKCVDWNQPPPDWSHTELGDEQDREVRQGKASGFATRQAR